MTNIEFLEEHIYQLKDLLFDDDVPKMVIESVETELKYWESILKELKAQKQEKTIEIIKKKCSSGNSNLWLVSCLPNYEHYMAFIEDTTNHDHDLVRTEHNELTQQEFDLLKEVLG